jgi:hypothetical protein
MQRVGCDWKLNSNAIEDDCGVCDGNGGSCNIINGTIEFKFDGKHKVKKPAIINHFLMLSLPYPFNLLLMSRDRFFYYYFSLPSTLKVQNDCLHLDVFFT